MAEPINKVTLILVLELSAICAVSSPAAADSRSLGLGGAYLAVGEDSYAQINNPANLSRSGRKEFRIIDLTLTGEMVDMYNYMLAFSSALTQTTLAAEEGSYIDLDTIKLYNDVLTGFEYIAEPGRGVMADNAFGTMQISLGNPSISIIPHIYLGIEPMIDMSALTSGDIAITTGTLALDFSLIPASTGTPSAGLLGARDDVINVVNTLVTAGAGTGGLTHEQVANAIINLASQEGVVPDEIIVEIAGDVDTMLPLFESLYVLTTSTAPEIYLDDIDFGLKIKDLNVAEIVLGFSYDFINSRRFYDTILGDMIVGMNIKYITGEAIYKRLNFAEIQYKNEHPEYEYLQGRNRRASFSWGMDLGFTYDRKEEGGYRLALSMKNVNRPEFKPPLEAEEDGVEFVIEPTARFGTAFWPSERIALAADVDLIKSPTYLLNYYEQMFAAGVEYVVFHDLPEYNVTLRGGFNRNMAVSYDSELYTIGIGMTLMSVTLDLAFTYSPVGGVPIDQVSGDIAGGLDMLGFEEFPEKWQLSAGFGFRFK